VQKIQPMGFSGGREEIVAPTVEKDPMARSEMMAPAAPSVLFSGRGYRKLKTTVRTTSSTVSAHSDQASQAAARSLIPSAPWPCPLAPSVTTPLYSTTVSTVIRGQYYGSRERAYENAMPANFGERRLGSTLAIGLHSKPHCFRFLGCP
jgi:hypothetical protein